MKNTLLIAFLTWLLSAATIPARADDLEAARKAIEAQYARLDAATARKDPSPLEGLVAPDFRDVDVTGDEFDLSQHDNSLAADPRQLIETLTARSEVQSVAFEGDTARAVTRTVLEGTLKQAGGSLAKFRGEAIVHDAWVKIGTEWRLRRPP